VIQQHVHLFSLPRVYTLTVPTIGSRSYAEGIRGICRGLSPGWSTALHVPVESGFSPSTHATVGWISREATPNNITSPRPVRAVLASSITVDNAASSSSAVVARYNNQAAGPSSSDAGARGGGGDRGGGAVGDDAAEAVVVVSLSQPTTTSTNFTIISAVAVNVADAAQPTASLVTAAVSMLAGGGAAEADSVATAATASWQQFWNRSRVHLPTQPKVEAFWLGAQYNLACVRCSGLSGDLIALDKCCCMPLRWQPPLLTIVTVRVLTAL
jgi:hypothetical protein